MGICARCGGPTKCTYEGDIGAVDFYDKYVLRCLNCGRETSITEYASAFYGDGLTRCPFCQKLYAEHP